MSTTILPLQSNLLLVSSDRNIISPSYNFSHLPYTDKEHDISPNTPFLSESIASMPFERLGNQLEAGVHLHWILPAIFRKSIVLPVITRDFISSILPRDINQNKVWDNLYSMDQSLMCRLNKNTLMVRQHFSVWKDYLKEKIPELNDNALLEERLLGHGSDGKNFPPVPNRYQVVRLRDNKEEKRWTIESDYIHPVPPELKNKYSCFPWLHAYESEGEVPFRYIGRVAKKEEGVEKEEEETKPYLFADPKSPTGPLTALGYGEPSFSAFYPNCRSVFGFCDEEITTGEELHELEYQITGYYGGSSSVGDFHLNYWEALISYFISEAQYFFPADNEQHVSPEVAEKRKNHFSKSFKDHFGLEIGDEVTVDMICHVRIEMGMASLSANYPIEVTVANSGTEAIAASLASLVTKGKVEGREKATDSLENTIESILMDDRLAGKKVDLSAKFHEFRHEQEFQSVNSDFRWVLQSLENGREASVANTETEEEAEKRKKKEAEDRTRLFKKLSLLNSAQREYSQLLEELVSVQKETFDDWHLYMKCLYPEEGILNHFPQADQLKDYMEQVNLPEIKRLKRVSGSLLLNHGERGNVQAATAHPGGTQESKAIELSGIINDLVRDLQSASLDLGLFRVPGTSFKIANEPTVCLSGSALLGLLHKQTRNSDINHFCTSENSIEELIKAPAQIDKVEILTIKADTTGSWNPLFLDWQLDFYPVAGEKKPNWRGDHYTTDYITSNFQLEENQADLSLKKGKGVVATNSESIRGRSALDPFSSLMVREKLWSWCQNKLSVESKKKDLMELEKFAGNLENTLDNEVKRSLILQVLNAIKMLDEVPMLTQSLTGFNNALTGHRWGWQLPIADPLGFQEYQEFADRVRLAVDRETLAAPLPFNDFHPISSGEIKFEDLRLVDSFGQHKDLAIGKVHGTKKMRNAKQGHLRLPVRILQAARLNFRWIQREMNHLESHGIESSSPIAGWLLPEFLERQLLLFNHEGEAIGAFREKGKLVSLASEQELEITSIEDQSLRGFAKFLKEYLAVSDERINDLLLQFHEATEHTEPETAQDDDFVALLFGNPLAIVHAQLSIELQGSPKTNGSWDETWRKITAQQRSDASNGFTEVEVPVRIGEHHQLNDGVMSWWEWEKDEEKQNLLKISEWHLPQALNGNRKEEETPDYLKTFLNDESKHLGMLINPFGVVHISCGVLPVKSIDLPAIHYQQALGKLNGSLFAGPIITPENEIAMQLPKLIHHQWKWVGPEAGQLSFKDPNLTKLPEQLCIREGRVQLQAAKEVSK
ncbi:hypothetical protein [Marivirga lumbricoides]